jgi:hypothetical protein
MTADKIDPAEPTRQAGDLRASWSVPAVKRIRAGDAEDGFDPVTPDATLTAS